MAFGYTDANGVYIYGTSDDEATHDALLNLQSDVLSTTIGGINTQIDALTVHALQPFATVALLLASTGSSADDYAVAANAPGAFWRHTGSGWTMYGVAHFADVSARSTAITAPAVGMRSKRANVDFEEIYTTEWVPAFSGGRAIRVLRSSGTPTISSAGYTDLSTTANWSTSTPGAQSDGFASYSNGITIPTSGVYRVGYSFVSAANIALLSGVTVNKNAGVSYLDFKAPASTPAVQSIAAVNAVEELRFAANDVLRLYAIAASGTPATVASMGSFWAEWVRAD